LTGFLNNTWAQRLVFWVLVPVAVIYGIYNLHSHHFCILEGRFVPDQEALLVGVAADKLSERNVAFVRNTKKMQEVANLLKTDPECCKLLSGDEQDWYLDKYYGFLERFLGRASRILLVKGSMIDPVDPNKGQSVWIVPISSCGLQVTETYSFTTGKNFSNRWYGDNND
jgi:hypothetical protein